MLAFLLRRFLLALVTLASVMLLTFLLLGLTAGDISAQYLPPNATSRQRQEWLHKHKLDLPLILNFRPESAADSSAGGVFNSQFFWHVRNCLTFQGESFKYKLKLTDIIAERARYSLALTVPALALGWLLAMAGAAITAYYRGGLVDRLGVLVCVVGMCVPILVYMIVGQSVALELAPQAAMGVTPWTNIYVPVAIAVFAGLGGHVRFYRTIMLNEVGQDYVRTARAKGVPLPGVLFGHVLKNCMLPILTALVAGVPFLILGSLVIEQFFGIPGLGSLVRTSVTDRDIPIASAITFLTAAGYIAALLVTDVLYALFDPRIRLR